MQHPQEQTLFPIPMTQNRLQAMYYKISLRMKRHKLDLPNLDSQTSIDKRILTNR